MKIECERRIIKATTRMLNSIYTMHPDGKFLITPMCDHKMHDEFLHEYYEEEEHF